MANITPNINDVLLGKGTIINTHPGNQQFRSLVNSHKHVFLKAKNKVKREIAMQIFCDVENLQPPGRFLVEDRSHIAKRGHEERPLASVSNSNVHPNLLKKRWLVVEQEKALDKIMHRLRERVDVDTTAAHPIQMSVEEDDVDDLCRSGDNELQRNHSAPETPEGDAYKMGLVMDGKSNALSLHSGRILDDTISMEQQSVETNLNPDEAEPKGQVNSVRESKSLDDVGHDFKHASSLNSLQYTLRQWILKSKPKISMNGVVSTQSNDEVAEYTKSALLIALKLTEYLLEAEKDEQNGLGNPIPLASIAPENVLIRVKARQCMNGKSSVDHEMIDSVWIINTSFVGGDSVTGAVMARLFAMGKLLRELFSTKEFVMDDDMPAVQTASMESINLSSKTTSAHHAQKKTHLLLSQADENELIDAANLASNGIQWSLYDLVNNLLECQNDPFCNDDAYASFDDLQVDLQLMVDNPSCFLDNIHISNVRKLTVPDKLYGRDKEMLKLDEFYRIHITGKSFNGTIISGGAGVGKSTLALYLQKLTVKSNGFFLSAKFEQNQMSLKPFSTIANLFDSLCHMLFVASSPEQLTAVENDMMSSLGSQPNLLGVVPNLKKLMPSCVRIDNSSSNCVDSALSMRYLCGELLLVISSHLKPITIVIDDIQFADHASLILVRSLVVSARRASVFLCLCHRNDEASLSESFNAWLTSISMFSLEPITLESITTEAVNNLLSEALQLSPRLTRPLSSVLHHKTRGNPLFLRQLLDSLTEQGYIVFNMHRHRWAWDLDTIIELEISESVLALLMNEIQRLPDDLQCGLQVASCIGSCISESILNYLLIGLGFDLKEILRKASKKGFMIDIAGSKMFRFAHDKIRQAAYELMPERQRRENHMQIGLVLCTQSLNNITHNEELFFAAVNQINQGGPTAVHEPSQRNIIAELNLKAGRRSIELSDYNTAFTLFQHGISFLGENYWLLSYQLSLDLHDAVAEAALILNRLSAVTYYTNEVVLHGRGFEDKLHCLCTSAKALGMVSHHQEQSIKASFAILAQFRENLPRESGDDTLRTDIDRMNHILLSMSDDTICNMQDNDDKKMTILIYLYAALAHLLQYFKPWLAVSVSLRMVELTMNTGLNAQSPLAFAHFGGNLITDGRITEGCRLGKLALKLVEKKGSLQFKSRVIYFVYHNILWASEPLQLIVESHLMGHKAGQQSGDVLYAFNNLLNAIYDDYFSGQSFDVVHKNIRNFLWKLHSQGLKIFFKLAILLLSQIMVLKEGLHMSDIAHVDNMPSEGEILADASSGPSISAYGKIHHLSRSFLFRQIDDTLLHIDISGTVTESHHQLNPHYLMGYFFEGLASFQLARRTGPNKSSTWIERGKSVLAKMQCWSEHSLWNWMNKMLLLEAEIMSLNGEFDRAGPLYDSAIRSARDHNFIHEEAIASELAGTFYYERGLRQKSYSCLVHSVNCYEKWGADAVARRVKSYIQGNFRTGADHPLSIAETLSE